MFYFCNVMILLVVAFLMLCTFTSIYIPRCSALGLRTFRVTNAGAMRAMSKVTGTRIVRSSYCSSSSSKLAACESEYNWNHEPLRLESDNRVTVKQAFIAVRSLFDQNNIPESEESARHLICHAATLGVRFSDFTKNLERVLNGQEIDRLQESCSKRLQRVPIQYIVGNWDFYGMTLQCRPPVLIPRPETEELVEHIINSEIVKRYSSSGKELRILDIGAGTGAIGIALAENIGNCCVVAIDINDAAVHLANENADRVMSQKNREKYRCIHFSLNDFVNRGQNKEGFHIIVSNPPYIPSKDIASLEPEVVKYEDSRALDGGHDGLNMVRDLFSKCPQLVPSQYPSELWLEVSREHPPMIENILREENSHWKFVESFQDFLGNPRFVRLLVKQDL
jgi:release factor glutamine methyltransferase